MLKSVEQNVETDQTPRQQRNCEYHLDYIVSL